MRYVLMFIGAAVVAFLVAMGIYAFNSERRIQRDTKDDGI